MFEMMPNSNLKNFTGKSAEGVILCCFFQEKKFCRRTNRKVGKRGENLARNTFFESKLKLPHLYSRYRGKFSDFRTLETKKAISLIDAECTIIDTPSDVRNYAQLKFEKFHRKVCKGGNPLVFFRGKKILSQNES